ncbi:hypothetical protein [Dactylosporangium cerinum]
MAEQRLRERAGQVLRHREPTSVDCRTFIADRLPYLNDLLHRRWPVREGNDLDAVVGYALAGSAKRLRPALGLMLAEGLGIAPSPSSRSSSPANCSTPRASSSTTCPPRTARPCAAAGPPRTPCTARPAPSSRRCR